MVFDKLQSAIKNKVLPPQSQAELLDRCQHLEGKTLGQVAAGIGRVVPDNLKRNKGWVGSLLEAVLGADAGNKAQPDFIDLAIEMKIVLPKCWDKKL